MAKIHKFEFGTYEALRDGVTVMLPESFEGVHMERRDGVLNLWAQVDPSDPLGPRRFVAVATGRQLPYGFRHVFTYTDGPFVAHIGEVPVPVEPSVMNFYVDTAPLLAALPTADPEDVEALAGALRGDDEATVTPLTAAGTVPDPTLG